MKLSRTAFHLAAACTICSLMLLAASCTPQQQSSKTAKVSTQKQAQPVAAEKAKPVRFTANQFCAACHADFAGEPFAVMHQQAGIGCERCHGESERHRSDEDNITPPDMMYPKARINPTCMMCHPRQDIQNVPAHDKLLAGAETIFDEKPKESANNPQYCTDCHAPKHKMNVRTIRWNKATGELLTGKK